MMLVADVSHDALETQRVYRVKKSPLLMENSMKRKQMAVVAILAWTCCVGVVHGVKADEQPPLLTDTQVASLNCLTIDENRILAVARPDMARRFNLTPQQTQKIQAMVVEFVELKYGPVPKLPPLSQKARDAITAKQEFPSNGLNREQIREIMKSAEDELAPRQKAVRDRHLRLSELQDKFPAEVESLMTTAQKESFQRLQPKDIPAAKVLAKVTFEIPAGQSIRSGGQSIGTGFALSPDEKTLAVGGAGNVLLYSVPDGSQIGTLPVEADGKQRTPFKVAISLVSDRPD